MRRIAVIGAGIVGMSAALHLQRDGHRVSVLDPCAPGTMTSFGNAGGIVAGAVMPTSTPGLWKQVPAMLLDPMSPLRIRWQYLPRLAPWLLHFLRTGSRAQVEIVAQALSPLVSRAVAAHRELARLARAEDLVLPAGWLKLYETQASFAAGAHERAQMRACGAHFEVLGPEDIRQLEPGIARGFVRGLFQPDSAFAPDPGGLVRAYASRFVGAGGVVLPEEVRRVIPQRTGVRVATDRSTHAFDAVVVAAGAWSGRIARTLGDRVLLDTERGYHLNLERGAAAELRRPVFFVDRRFVLAPMHDGIRLTSGVEFAGLEAPPDFTRIRRLLPAARSVLPGLSDQVTREWMGRRPSTPDSLPVIGRSPGHPQVIYAFGHGHIGLTLGPLTGKLVADLAAGRPAELDLSPYRVNRF